MRKIFALLLIACTNVAMVALDIPKGTFYFDNSKTGYSNVKFVYGKDSSPETYVASMTNVGNNRWKITMTEAVTDMYRYTFANTTLADGKISQTFSAVKDNISNTRNENRTSTTSDPILLGGVYAPTSGDNWAAGVWQTLSATVTYSGTLPVFYVNTDGGVEITSTEEYITGSCYLDNMGDTNYESLGSASVPMTMKIRGRGNYSWNSFEKKPYRIKLDVKEKLMGMKKNRNFVLLSHSDDDMAFLRNTVGFEISRKLGMMYTPAQEPVEVVLNGEYVGLYMLTETPRVGKNRVNITEQLDNETGDVTGGWLCEIDNYDGTEQIKLTEGNGEVLRISYKSPEILSSKQLDYLTTQMQAIDKAFYATDKNSTAWENIVDMDTLARFYVVQEVMDNAESFHGSCYLHKDIGETSKWIFGPVWDFGNSFHRKNLQYIHTDTPYGQTWIHEVAKFPRFQNKVKEIWKQFNANDYASLDGFIDQFVDRIYSAAQHDALKWPQYGIKEPYAAKRNFKEKLKWKTNWLVSQWGGIAGVDEVASATSAEVYAHNGSIEVYSLEDMAQVRVVALNGAIVANVHPADVECIIDCEAGFYVVEVILADGSKSVHKVVVK